MARTIKVDPVLLRGTATQVGTAAAEYKQLYAKLYSEVDGLAAAWQGEDNLAFTTQIRGFTEDFDKMAQLMDEYSKFLNDAATADEKTQDEIANQARSLAN